MELRRLEDESQLRTLVATYAHAVARRDADAWGGTWAEDSAWNLLGQSPRGREAIVALWSGLMTRFEFVVHRASDPILGIDGDRATGVWAITEQGRSLDGEAMLLLGRYDDVYVRTSQGWRFAERSLEVFYQGAPAMGVLS